MSSTIPRLGDASCVVLLCALLMLAACSTATETANVRADETLIPAGPFQMGCSPDDEWCGDDERPLHEVTLDSYLIDKYEVTNAHYARCVDAGECTPPQGFSSARRNSYYASVEYAAYPVINVDWNQANSFCAWEGKRLPTEAEWEKAARGNEDTRIYPWGNDSPDCGRLNFYDDVNKQDLCTGDTAAVGSLPAGASPYGVMDMTGNVWEWVNDWYAGSYYRDSPGANPTGPKTGEARVLRGGSWLDIARNSRLSDRNGGSLPGNENLNVGFRCVRQR
jgi:eukaryotic-like serine/threonine-protein kinase